MATLSACAHFSSGAAPPPAPLHYQAGADTALATVVAPTATPGTATAVRRQPVVVLLHGGFGGDDRIIDHWAQQFAARGVLAVLPSYRGEKRALDGQRSPGKVEFCDGEVGDTLALLAALRQRPDVDPERIALVGFSHGGCIAQRSGERDPRLAEVVTFSAPTDAAYTYDFLRAHPAGMFFFAGALAGKLRGYVGGDPKAAPQAWAQRSPLRDAAALRDPLLMIHGTSDPLVPVQETCMMRDALVRAGHRLIERHFDGSGLLQAGVSGPCAPPPTADVNPSLPWLEVWYIKGQGHLFTPKAQRATQDLVLGHLASRLGYQP